MDWYIVEDGEAAGPFKESEVRRWLGSGKLSPETHATHEGVNEWKPLSELLPDNEAAENLPPAFSPEEPISFPLESDEMDSTESPGVPMPISRICGVINLRRRNVFEVGRGRWWGLCIWPHSFGPLNYLMEWAW